MNKIVFLCSGGGGTMKFVAECIQRRIISGCEVSAVIADRQCEALEYAKLNNLENHIVEYSQSSPSSLQRALLQLKPDLIITTFHKIIDPLTVVFYSGKMINLHYSLLPAFKGKIGAATVRGAIDNGCKILGTTVHSVEKEVDSGCIISQNACPVCQSIDFAAVMDRVFRLGCLNLINAMAIMGVARSDGFKSSGGYPDSLFSPPLQIDLTTINESLWKKIK